MLPKEVVAKDRLLEEQTEKASTALMELRWHWTLNELNPERVSLREYARATGKSFANIAKYANGYALHLSDPDIGITDAQERASMGAETWAATEAVAEARGIQPTTARQSRPVEVRRVREIARQRAEDKGTTVGEEAPKVAEWIVKAEKADAERQEDRKERLGLRYIAVEAHLLKAQKALIAALNESHSVAWGDEERELLSSTLESVRALLNLVDLALVGSAEVDWDAELAALTKE